ncbi:hypothetical protein N3K63_04665 [Microbacterium sp. W1N]|uniref:hypothetical protein n=1 Tax=Microbacterium festucae TaxID=2977531 RepID=UPI0021C11C89|nr:hypothetical protein [Microbacterium festucae]MCT9819576.1 hypothetical protein [Microbacterium festucae]
MDREDEMRVAAGETDALPPAPVPDDDNPDDALPDDIDQDAVHVAPGAGGPDDGGDVEVDPRDLHLPGRE